MSKTVVMLWSVALLSALPLQAEPRNPLPAEQVEQIAGLIEAEMNRQGVPGLSVAVGVAEGVWSAGYGLADVENSVPARAETLYRTASIAKPLTAVLVLDLAEDGVIDLDAPVQTYCGAYPEKAWPLTSRQLLGHLGGVRHYKTRDESTSTKHYFSLQEALSAFASDPLLHEPGTNFRYSTFGYNLLGSVVEGAADASYFELLRKRVLNPCGMTATLPDDQLRIIPGRARGYSRPDAAKLASFPQGHGLEAGQLYNAPLHDTSMKIPGGGLLSTASDLVRFAMAAHRRRVLKAETLEEMWTSGRTAAGKSTGYGLGWSIATVGGRRRVSHGGGQAGVSTYLLLAPDTGVSVALMCNLQGTRLAGLAESILAIVQPVAAPTDYGRVGARVAEAIRSELEQKSLPAFSIALVDNDRTVWAEGFGFQDAQKTIPATSNTVYRVGSVSKLFTDLAIMQLVERGELSLDAAVSEFLPSFAPRVSPEHKAITLRRLMSHRAGLVREPPVGNYFDPDEPSLAETVASLNQTSLVYPPGARTKYSNAGIAVVGAVLERRAKTPFAERIEASILKPLGMRHSSFLLTPGVEENLATGWMWTYDDRRFEAPRFALGMAPAGNLYSSVNDLSRFLSCLFAGGRVGEDRIFSEATLREMTTPQREPDGTPGDFGIGFHLQALDGDRKIGHGGAVYGFSTQLEALPERKLGVAAACSLDGSNAVVRRISDFALRLMVAEQDGKPLPAYPTTVAPPEDRIRELAGSYRSGEQRARVVAYRGRLLLERGALRHEVRAAAGTGELLVDDLLGFGIPLGPRADGRLAIGDSVYERLPDRPPAESPARWRGLIGEYGWDHNTLYILEDQGELVALIEWFYRYPLREISEDEFAFPDFGLYHGERLKFVRDGEGRASRVTAAEVVFHRRQLEGEDGSTFKIQPVRPISELRAAALAAQAPQAPGRLRDSELVELTGLDDTIHLDIRYATKNNFTGAVFYRQPRAFLQRPAAEAVARVHQKLKTRGLGLLIHDAYRPWHVTRMFWDATPQEFKKFVANPATGSRHNRGCAVDLTLYDLATGEPISMVAGYDEFSSRSFPLYPGGTERQRWHRELLRESMEAEGFSIYEFEWWHFDYRDWEKYRIGNVPFEELQP